MKCSEDWLALSVRIRGLLGAGRQYASIERDIYGAGKYLLEQCASAIQALKEFQATHEASLSPEAMACLDHFFQVASQTNNEGTRPGPAAAKGVVILSAFESEMTFILSGRQDKIRARSERAFLHLQRTLAADDEVRAKWQAAYKKGEVECEKLGSLHLLSHGIYAFKANAEGARTDLIFAQPPSEESLLRSVEGIVHTEWKKAGVSDVSAKFEEAKKQALLYRKGILAGIELAGYCYLIVVSSNQIELPADEVTEAGIVFRYINITIDPDTPSRGARRKA